MKLHNLKLDGPHYNRRAIRRAAFRWLVWVAAAATLAIVITTVHAGVWQ